MHVWGATHTNVAKAYLCISEIFCRHSLGLWRQSCGLCPYTVLFLLAKGPRWGDPPPLPRWCACVVANMRRRISRWNSESGQGKWDPVCSSATFSLIVLLSSATRGFGAARFTVLSRQWADGRPLLWTPDCTSSITCHYLPGSHTIIKLSAWWWKHTAVNIMAKVFTQ